MRSIDAESLIETTPDLWQKIIQVNLIGTYNILRVVIPEMIKRNNTKPSTRRIVIFGSNVSRIGLPNGTAYSASKAAISNLCRSLSIELGPQNILINTISPGPIEIDNSHFSPEYRKFREQYYEEMLKQTPLKRLAKPEDIVSFASFLISEENNFITGEEFFITGGKL